MSEMVERVKRALREFEARWTLDTGSIALASDAYETAKARAVIAAMREPTEEMLRPDGDTIYYFDFHRRDDAAAIWREMIDQILR